MKILHVIRTMDPAWGGPVEAVKNIAAHAAVLGHSLEITCLDVPQAPWLKGSDLCINAIGPGRFGMFGYSRRLDSWLASNISRFDVVVANGIWMYFSAAVRRAATRARVPYYVFTHGALDPWFKHRYPLKQIKKQLYWSLFEHKVLRDAAAVLFTTAEEQAVSRWAFWPYRCNAKVVGYGIADPFLSNSNTRSIDRTEARQLLKSALPEVGERQFLLFLARIHEKKGIDLLLQAIARNNDSYQEYAFVIAGPGKDTYVSELKAQAVQLGLEKKLIWAGPLYGELKWAAIREAEAYILPSHQENFGISVVEALACSVPVLITDKVNIWREIVAEGGGLAGSDDVSGISRLLEKWSGLHPEQRAAMRECARRCFLNHFEIRRTSADLFDLYTQHRESQHNETALECVS
jgi:glycosyltransferase involved in cell wall biosynthesis